LLTTRRATGRPKVFQIGFNRCGTTSILFFFRKNGYTAVHRRAGRFSRAGTLAAGIELARREGKPLLTFVGVFDVYTDMECRNLPMVMSRRFPPRIIRKLFEKLDPEKDLAPIYAYKYFKELDQQYPDSKFILNTRNVDNWVGSRLRFQNKKYRSCIHGDDYHKDEAELVACWKSDWHDQHRDVKEYFRDRPSDLLVFDIEKDDPAKLVEFFVSYRLDKRHWIRTNASR